MFGGKMLSALHNWRDVTPGLWWIKDSTEKSTGLNSNSAMRSMKRSMMVSAVLRAL